jgi:hypothetical protein
VAPSPQVGNNDVFTNVEVNIVENAVAVAELNISQPLKVYPHPIRSVFTLSNVDETSPWSMSDASGRLVLEGTGPTGNASGLSPGIYMLHMHAYNEAIPVWVVR